MSHRVAVVEDNPDNRMLVRALLEDRFEISEFESGVAAVDGLPHDIPDLVLLDISLPEMDGTEVLAWIREQDALKALPVIALTAHAMAGDREKYLAAGFNDYVTKPIVDEDVLIEAIERWLPPDGLIGESEGTVAPAPAGSGVEDPARLVSEESWMGPDRAREHVVLYGVLFVVLLAGAVLLRGNLFWTTGATAHTVMEAISTVLAAIIGGLALVRYYSRKQATFLLIGTGFLGAAILNLNHTLITSDALIDALAARHPGVDGTTLFAWSWTAERVFLSLFLFVSLLAWRQEVRDEHEGADEVINEASVYGSAFVLTLVNLLFFENVPSRR